MNTQLSLVEMIDQKLENGEVELPVFDEVAHKVFTAIKNNTADAEEICEILKEDMILVSEVLRMANSSFFSGLGEINTIQDAVVRLGLKQISTLVLSVSQKRMYSASNGKFHDRMVQLWEHASAASLSARSIAKAAGYKKLSDEVHVAALLHDVGKLSLLRIIEELEKSGDVSSSDELVDATLDKLYCEHGAKLLESWDVPEVFRNIVRNQDASDYDQSDVALTIVRLADRVCAKEGVSDRPDPDLCLESLPETQWLGIDDITLAELRIVIEDARAAA